LGDKRGGAGRAIAGGWSFQYDKRMQASQPELEMMRMLAQRLERLSVDSHWAHRASGVRGNLLRVIESLETGEQPPMDVQALLEMAFDILRRGAGELRGDEPGAG
jgi:hypothetical protein